VKPDNTQCTARQRLTPGRGELTAQRQELQLPNQKRIAEDAESPSRSLMRPQQEPGSAPKWRTLPWMDSSRPPLLKCRPAEIPKPLQSALIYSDSVGFSPIPRRISESIPMPKSTRRLRTMWKRRLAAYPSLSAERPHFILKGVPIRDDPPYRPDSSIPRNGLIRSDSVGFTLTDVPLREASQQFHFDLV
jgi:hypothetical protein